MPVVSSTIIAGRTNRKVADSTPSAPAERENGIVVLRALSFATKFDPGEIPQPSSDRRTRTSLHQTGIRPVCAGDQMQPGYSIRRCTASTIKTSPGHVALPGQGILTILNTSCGSAAAEGRTSGLSFDELAIDIESGSMPSKSNSMASPYRRGQSHRARKYNVQGNLQW
jgi:hypothetical protein